MDAIHALNSNKMNQALSQPFYVPVMSTKNWEFSNFKAQNLNKSLISDVGCAQKTSDKLMFALISIKYPHTYEEDLAFEGHPMVFMKILHYSIFYASKAVATYLYSKDVDPNTVTLNDYQFMEKIFSISVSHFGLKPRLNISQFFKHGFAEQKMMMCVDAIKGVKELYKAVKLDASLGRIKRPAQAKSVKRFSDKRLGWSMTEVREDMNLDFQTSDMNQA
jgi:hypothetical protein